jgi:hypothetical protein
MSTIYSFCFSHGRENITEILDVTVGTDIRSDTNSKRIESCPADLRSSAAAILSRLHGSQLHLFSSLEKIILSGIRMPQRSLTFQQNAVVASHIVSATKILSSNLQANFDYVSRSYEADAGEEKIDKDDTSLVNDAAICMYLGTQLNALHSSLCEDKREEHRRIFNTPLLINLLVGDGWRDGIYALSEESADVLSTQSEPQIMSAIRFVLMFSLRDMAFHAAKEEEQIGISNEGVPRFSQRMSRAVASSLPPTLSLLERLISRPLLVESQIATVLTKMKESDFMQLITNLPGDPTLTTKFNAAQFARALHLKLAKITFEFWSDDRFACVPCHVMHPWIQYVKDVIRSLEEAGKVIDLAPATATTAASNAERLGLSGRFRDLHDPYSRSGRLLASMGLLQDPGADRRGEERGELFVPSEESISQLSEMGFGRDHAVEALESVGSNRVDVAMEYALLHPPSSPATLERTRAARERRRLEQQRRDDSERTGGQPTVLGDSTGGTQNKPLDSESHTPKQDDGDKAEDQLKAITEKEIEEKLAARALDYLKMVKESLCKISLDIIEGSSKGSEYIGSSENTKNEGSDKRGVVIVVSNFLLDICRVYPALESSIGSELLRRLKFCLEDPRRQSDGDIKPPSHCRVKSGCSSFAALVHTSVIIFRA